MGNEIINSFNRKSKFRNVPKKYQNKVKMNKFEYSDIPFDTDINDPHFAEEFEKTEGYTKKKMMPMYSMCKYDKVSKNFIASGENRSENDKSLHSVCKDVEKYSSLLREIEYRINHESGDDFDMEATWHIGLEEKSEKLVKKKIAEKEDKTPFEQYLDKRKEKRKQKRKLKKQRNNDNLENSDIPSDIDMDEPYFAEEFNKPEFSKKKNKKRKLEKNESEEESNHKKKAELELLLASEERDYTKHFSLKKIQDKEDKSKQKTRKNKRKTEHPVLENDGFEINVNDPRFSAVFSSHLYNIDPSDSHYKKTEGMEKLIKEKLKRSIEGNLEVVSKKADMNNSKKMRTELEVLLKNVKRNVAMLVNK